jgi:dihydroorotate dehydrogenase
MEVFVTGATDVQIGTANFAEPVVSARLLDGLPAAVAELGAAGMADLIR